MAQELYENLQTILTYFYQWEEEKPNDVFLRQPTGNTWEEFTWKEVGQQARKMLSLIHI